MAWFHFRTSPFHVALAAIGGVRYPAAMGCGASKSEDRGGDEFRANLDKPGGRLSTLTVAGHGGPAGPPPAWPLTVKRIFKLPGVTHGNGPVISQWQRKQGNYLATSGVNKLVNIWDRSGSLVREIHLPGRSAITETPPAPLPPRRDGRCFKSSSAFYVLCYKTF